MKDYFKEAVEKNSTAGTNKKTKILLTYNNIPYDSGYNHIPYFTTEADRDLWINNNLFNGEDYKELLENSPNRIPPITNSITNNVLNFGMDYEDGILNKNYAIVKQGDITTFHFITGIFDAGNQKTYNLVLQKDVAMSNIGFMDNLKNFKLSQGQIDSNNYFGYQISGGNKEVYSIQDFPQPEMNEVYNQLKNKGWLVVLERVNNESDYIVKVHNGNEFKEPYKIYIAPLTPFSVRENLTDETILYSQSSPNKYPVVSNSNPKVTIQIGLSNVIDLNLDVTIFSDAIGEDNTTKKTFTIKQEWFPVLEDDERIIVVPYQGDEGIANTINNNIPNGVAYNERLLMNDYTLGTIAGDSQSLYYLPLKIKKLSQTLYSFETILVSEWINYIPKAYTTGVIQAESSLYQYEDLLDRYGLFCLPNRDLISITIYKISQTTQNTWSADKLFNYLEDPENTNIIGAKTTNFIPIDTNQADGVFEIAQSNNITQNGDEIDNQIFRLASLNYDNLLKVNQYSFNLKGINKLELINGLSKFSLSIENLKEFAINPNFIDNGYLSFIHYASFTPSWEERFKYISTKYLSLTNENNALINSKEFLKGSDNLAQYRVNNPVAWKDFARPVLDPLTDFLPFLGGGGDKAETGTKFLPFGISGARLGLQELGAGLSRISLKKQPDQFSGNGDINGDLVFNENGIKLSLVTYNFTTPERNGIIETIKRKGMTYENNYISDYETIKRPIWNFIKIENFNDSDVRLFKFSNEERSLFAAILERGTTLWNDPNNNYLDYEEDNEDGTF